ncbi:oligosaccharide flippase family protein [Maribacter sp. CXY002]|uniref:oligosaccharide flippase family protein n=1 Tax=Maribacter luteocoastalis TaxID=3407671 RepID=UPI003B67D729
MKKLQFKRHLKKDSILNLCLRGLTILCKFLLSILIVKKLSVNDLGVFGIFQTTITLVIYILGFDFYTYNARELIKNERGSINYYIGNQAVFHLLVYLIVLPLSFFLFLKNIINIEYVLYFYIILVFEHISQEIYRMLIAIKKSVIASLTLFLRSGLWVLMLFMFWELIYGKAEISLVFSLWIVGVIISIIVGVVFLKFKPRFKVDLYWIGKGIKMSLPFLIATIFYKIIEFSGRYFLDFYWTKEEVGIFTFYSGISNAMFVFVQSMVIVVMSPYLIESSNIGKEEFFKVFKKYKKQIITTTIIGFLLACICIYPLLFIIGNELLLKNIDVFLLLLLAVVFFCFSYIPHYGLYVYHQDKQLLSTSIMGACVVVLLNFSLVPRFGVLGASFAQVISMFTLFISKWFIYRKFKNEN